MTGELPEPLLEAVQQTQLARDVEATALYVIAAWCQKHRQGVLRTEYWRPRALWPGSRSRTCRT